MPRFLIEIPHEASKAACERAVQALMSTGSHLLTNADWGCPDDEHKAWIVVDIESKEAAATLIPPPFRQDAKIITLQNFSLDTAEENRDLYHE
jgi:hypothetical protein